MFYISQTSKSKTGSASEELLPGGIIKIVGDALTASCEHDRSSGSFTNTTNSKIKSTFLIVTLFYGFNTLIFATMIK